MNTTSKQLIHGTSFTLINLLKRTIKKAFDTIKVDIRKGGREYYPEFWMNMKEFQSFHKEIEGRTVVTQDRCFMLYQLARYANRKEGEIAEVGVFKGGTGKLIAKTCPDKTIHLFDTFSGMPQVDSTKDYHEQGDFSETSLESVKEFLGDCNNALFHPGFFPETADVVEDTSFCLVYVDVDIYQSVEDCLEFFYERMIPGGIMVFDDYEWPLCPGVKEAIDEFLVDKEEVPIITANYQCALIKL